ncbi:acyl-CoA dehydrogenase family protein [Pseudomonas citronellolis]|uniref:acyl-CoA dehydrogenase family protein n=1 Tax=Pseudomonas citronellolis TaxID=53408 RepID=UPI00209D3DBA|nr:acyl-CoA dehydrogenase family protein [Pseudomonas citronellolis]MCP1603233.1 alkylation response protein AidB-like acyl-CoA dehydrogenase [Pseudomonas citronellolis]MCP1654772.1 alkylation response protein AidB-like acyl-CoA dehydrogenase [Pseudomonas citronellolis]MCP1721428.1 alkylation response protein AidB-like acyl-CoA dehydrogenase [Pseudomonas citronellolis]
MLDPTLSHWLDAQAEALDLGHADPQSVLPQLASAGLFGIGVPEARGGAGGSLLDAVEAIAAVAGHSLTAAFVFWGQRAFIEYLLQSPNQALGERLLGELLDGRLAGATGLSNAMKFLSGIESLQVRATPAGDGWTLDGRLPWVTNLRKGHFVVAAAIEREGAAPLVAAIPSASAGLERSDDLQLLGLQSSNTAALDFDGVALPREWLLHDDARRYLPQVRPAFLGLQCAMTIGLARRALEAVREHLGGSRSVLREEEERLRGELDGLVARLRAGLSSGEFSAEPARLFRIRIGLAEGAAAAVQLELQASGGKAYLSRHSAAFARRWRESAFVPIVTPSLVQLRAELQRQEARA